MRFTHRRARRRDDEHLIPLINVIFLMLIFFMIVGQIEATGALQVEPPESLQEASANAGERLLLLAADGRLAMDGRVLSREALQAHLGTSRPADTTAEPAPPLTLKADAGVTATLLRETLVLLEDAGIGRVRLLTVAASQG